MIADHWVYSLRMNHLLEVKLNTSSGRFLEALLGVVVEFVARQAAVAGGRPRALRRTAHPSRVCDAYRPSVDLG